MTKWLATNEGRETTFQVKVNCYSVAVCQFKWEKQRRWRSEFPHELNGVQMFKRAEIATEVTSKKNSGIDVWKRYDFIIRIYL